MCDYGITFIDQNDFEKHVAKTISSYNETLKSIDLVKFNSNIIDPIKLTFDKNLFKKSIEEIIETEISRQRDKTNTNSIGYFHQYMFKYIDKCEVPAHGFDVIYTGDDGKKLYVELKNKYNTMNDSAQKDTAQKLYNQLLLDPDCIGCYLVEVIAPTSRNIEWHKTLRDGTVVKSPKIRRVSIDIFYEIVTGQKDAFYQICKQLPKTIDKLVKTESVRTVEKDTVIEELKSKNDDLLKALYLLAFESYNGFDAEFKDDEEETDELLPEIIFKDTDIKSKK